MYIFWTLTKLFFFSVNMTEMKTYSVVEFWASNSVAVIPNNWLKTSETCVWPNWQSASKLSKAVITHAATESSWEAFQIKVLKTTGIYNLLTIFHVQGLL